MIRHDGDSWGRESLSIKNDLHRKLQTRQELLKQHPALKLPSLVGAVLSDSSSFSSVACNVRYVGCCCTTMQYVRQRHARPPRPPGLSAPTRREPSVLWPLYSTCLFTAVPALPANPAHPACRSPLAPSLAAAFRRRRPPAASPPANQRWPASIRVRYVHASPDHRPHSLISQSEPREIAPSPLTTGAAAHIAEFEPSFSEFDTQRW